MKNRRSFSVVVVALLALAVAGSGSQAQAPGDSASRSDPSGAELLQSQVEEVLVETGLPALAVALAEGGGEPLMAAAGYADTERMVAATPETAFFIGSISKGVFAVVALQLVEDGLLSLDDPLSAYVEWPRGDEITIRMLLDHSSGIPDYFGSLSLGDFESGVPEFFSAPRPPADIFGMMPSREPTFDPGSEQSYSNTNGLLVGEVIEAATGRSLGEVLDERIVASLGLDNTFLYDATTIDRPRARGYCGASEWGAEPGSLVDCSYADEALIDSGDGSIVSSAADLLRFHRALRGGELLGPESWEAMRRVEPGRVNGLGYLIMTGPRGDHEGNVGRAMGHVSANVYYIEMDLFAVMLLNRGDAPLPMNRFLELRYGRD